MKGLIERALKTSKDFRWYVSPDITWLHASLLTAITLLLVLGTYLAHWGKNIENRFNVKLTLKSIFKYEFQLFQIFIRPFGHMDGIVTVPAQFDIQQTIIADVV